MADDGSQHRKPNLRSAVEDVKALATVLVMELESVLGRRLKLRSPAVLAAIGVVATLALTLVVVMVLLQAGDANAVSDNAALIAALVALGGVFTAQMVSIALEDRRSHEARHLEAQRAGEAALQNYFEAVGQLLIEQPLRRARPGDNLSTVVRVQTLSVLEGLDPIRKGILLRFLYESGLTYRDKPVVSLEAANLSDAILSLARLYKAYLFRANLNSANLSDAMLLQADLSRARLFHANLTNANLSGADLSGADLGRADLRGATGVTGQELEQQAYSLEGAIMPDGSKHP